MKIFIGFLGLACIAHSAFAAAGLFPKMPRSSSVNFFDCTGDAVDAKTAALSLEGLVNQSSAEVYLIEDPRNRLELDELGIPHPNVQPGFHALFQQYQARVKKFFVYDPARDWTWCLASMAAAQQDGIPVTEALKESLVSQFHWTGDVEDYRDNWSNRIAAYDWAIENLLPRCSRKVVCTLRYGHPLYGGVWSTIDYITAAKGFLFVLDHTKGTAEEGEVEKIFRTGGYTVGASIMGYSGDDMNEVANKFGIGYVASDFYDNGSFWASFPNQTFQQAPARPVSAQPGKVYVTFAWSDGDNLQVDQNATYDLWHDPARGAVPVGTTLSPCLQELNPKLLHWFYANKTANDELLSGPSGFQFIYENVYNNSLFPAWCDLNRQWLADAGFHSGSLWLVDYPGAKYRSYTDSCGLAGIFVNGVHRYAANASGALLEGSIPAMLEGFNVSDDTDIYDYLAGVPPMAGAPVFTAVRLTAVLYDQTRAKDGGGFTRVKRQVDRLNATFPGRFVFLLPQDMFATIKGYYRHP
jgi:hypothetical protein